MNKSNDPNGGYVSSEPGKKFESLAGQHPGAARRDAARSGAERSGARSAVGQCTVVSTRFGIPICRHDLRSSGTGEREHSWRIITYVKFFSLYWPRAGTRKTTD